MDAYNQSHGETVSFENPVLANLSSYDVSDYESDLEQESVHRDPWYMPDSDIQYTKMGPEGLCDWMKRHKCRAFFLSALLATGLFCAVYFPLSNIETLTVERKVVETQFETKVVEKEVVVEQPGGKKLPAGAWVGIGIGAYCFTNLVAAIVNGVLMDGFDKVAGEVAGGLRCTSFAGFCLSMQDAFLTCNYGCGSRHLHRLGCCSCISDGCCQSGVTKDFPFWWLMTCNCCLF